MYEKKKGRKLMYARCTQESILMCNLYAREQQLEKRR